MQLDIKEKDKAAQSMTNCTFSCFMYSGCGIITFSKKGD